jgi:hypothetical protein
MYKQSIEPSEKEHCVEEVEAELEAGEAAALAFLSGRCHKTFFLRH